MAKIATTGSRIAGIGTTIATTGSTMAEATKTGATIIAKTTIAIIAVATLDNRNPISSSNKSYYRINNGRSNYDRNNDRSNKQ